MDGSKDGAWRRSDARLRSTRRPVFVTGLTFGLLLLIASAAASAAPRMPVGFHDDATFRWSAEAGAALGQAGMAHASVVRTIADWREIAPARPRQASDSFDPAYRFGNLDDLVRNAQRNGLQVMITIWGTPRWANEGRGPNVAPTRPSDLADFARAIADRYSGRHVGFPHVGRYSIWNEPNLEIFLTPQFDRTGAIVSPRSYARLYRAGHQGIKAGNPTALVAIGETSNQGRDRQVRGASSDSVAPGTFARLLAREGNLSFDAYATHPYPTRPNAPPAERVRWPNVTLSQLSRFEKALDRWFGRRDIPIWITEFGYQTRQGGRLGVSETQQARYLSVALSQLKADLRVQLFIWFIFRDSAQGAWQSGLITERGRPKPSLSAFRSLARSMGGQTMRIAPGVKPTIRLPVPRLAFVSPAGSTIGITYRVYQGTRMVAVGQPAPRLQINQSVSFVASFTPAPRSRYTIDMDAGDISGNHVRVTYNLFATAGSGDGTRTLSDSSACTPSPRPPGPQRQAQRC